MAGFILCRSKYAKKPYYISNMAIHIYSLEELCYYIYNNIYLIGTDLVEEDLLTYIEQELEEPDLAKELDFLVKQNAGLSELVMTILRYTDYYSEAEIGELRDVIEKLDTQNALERLKARADNFLGNRRYDSAVCNYELIVYGKPDKTLSMEFYGNVWHNMGVAHGLMFSFQEAGICFQMAYELNHNEVSLKAYCATQGLLKGLYGIDDEDELMYVTCREIETLMDHATEDAGYSPVKGAFALKEEGKIGEYYVALDSLIDKWKMEYRNYIK